MHAFFSKKYCLHCKDKAYCLFLSLKMSMLMKKIMLLVVFWVALMAKGGEMLVIDTSDKTPLAGATVIAGNGMILGLTDGDGFIAVDPCKDFPLSVRCVGYEPVDVTEAVETIALTPVAYELGEVVVTPVDRPVKRVICFAREYSSGITGSDTLQLYSEYMAEAFITGGKVKGYRSADARPTYKAVRRYARITKDGRDTIFRPRYDDDIKDLSWFGFLAFLPDRKIEVPDAIKNGAESDSVPGKYGVKFIHRKKNNLFTKTADVLSDHKNRSWSPWFFKMLGFTVDINAGSWTLSFADNGSDSYDITDFITGTYNIHMIGRGKWLKKAFDTKLPIEMYTCIELYPVELLNCTVAEYKELRDDFSRMSFQYPADIRPMSPAVQRLVDRIDAASK